MNDNSSLSTSTFEPISNIRLTKMPDRPQPRDKLYESAGVRFRISERFVYKPRLNDGSQWTLYDGVTIPKKEDLILVGNPNMRTSKLVYILADQAEYRMLDISEIPFVTLAITRNIISPPPHMCFGQQSNKFQFTFGAQAAVVATAQSQIHPQTPPGITAPSSALASTQPQPQPQPQTRPQPQPDITSPVNACIAAITSYFDFTSQRDRTAEKRSQATAFEGDQDTEEISRRRRRSGVARNPYRRLLRTFLSTVVSMDQ